MFARSQYHEYFEPSDTAESRALLASISASRRAANQDDARMLASIAELFELRRRERGEREDWAVDTWAAVGSEVSAALRVSRGKAGGYMTNGLAMRQLPEVAAVFIAGDIDMQMFRTVVFRTGLITDDAVLAEVDRTLAARTARWPSMTDGKLASEIDRIVVKHDPDAVRRRCTRAADREVIVGDDMEGCTEVIARLFSTDAQAFDQRLDALAKTVCDGDPRTFAQRRADAYSALAARADRLACQCGDPNCPAADKPAPGPVVIHVVADEATLEGRCDTPAYVLGSDTLIPGELLLESGYRPSRALADFVRSRDLTCRGPGCDKPATQCDLDHTIPHPYGPTHAGNVKCLCRRCHILKKFWGWRDRQLADGTVIWTLPGQQTYVTTPGSALLFPSLMAPTPAPSGRQVAESEGDRTVQMPRRKTTRAQNGAQYIAAERGRNRTERRVRHGALLGLTPPVNDPDPPPF